VSALIDTLAPIAPWAPGIAAIWGAAFVFLRLGRVGDPGDVTARPLTPAEHAAEDEQERRSGHRDHELTGGTR
jgi:hypothetical protein